MIVAGRAGSVDRLRLVRLVVEEVEVGCLLVQCGVGDGDADHDAGNSPYLQYSSEKVVVSKSGPILVQASPS